MKSVTMSDERNYVSYVTEVTKWRIFNMVTSAKPSRGQITCTIL
jgi:hypothetical protein